jgi:hypothetical protein
MNFSNLRYLFATRTKRYLSSLGKRTLIRDNKNYLSKYHELYLRGEFNLENRKHFLEGWFFDSVGYFPNIEKPKTFNEKIQWYKLYYNDPIITRCIDKITFKDFIRETVGDEYVVPLLGVYSNAEEINFDELPDRFVIKANFGSSAKELIIVTDKSKLDIASTRKTISSWAKPWWRDSWGGYEFVHPRILIEEYIEQMDGQVYDYKFWCFNGDPKYVYVSVNRFRHHEIDIFDLNWEKQDLTFGDIPNSNQKIEKPKNLPLMIELSRRISKQFPFVRVDFYELGNRIYIGELTFYPNGGFEVFISSKWDKELGRMLILPKTRLNR